MLYGITLAFSLYLANQEANEARETVEREAGSLEGMFEIAEQLPQPQRDRIQELTESTISQLCYRNNLLSNLRALRDHARFFALSGKPGSQRS